MASTIRDLLADCLNRQGIDASAARIPIDGQQGVVERIWAAFREFAALPIEGLHPGLHVPGPGRGDTDRLSLEARLRAQPAKTNLRARPPSVLLSRQLYLVDADEEFREIDDASLRLVLADDFEADATTANTAIFGAGGAPAGPAPAADWIAEVERSAAWRQVVESGALSHAVLE